MTSWSRRPTLIEHGISVDDDGNVWQRCVMVHGGGSTLDPAFATPLPLLARTRCVIDIVDASLALPER